MRKHRIRKIFTVVSVISSCIEWKRIYRRIAKQLASTGSSPEETRTLLEFYALNPWLSAARRSMRDSTLPESLSSMTAVFISKQSRATDEELKKVASEVQSLASLQAGRFEAFRKISQQDLTALSGLLPEGETKFGLALHQTQEDVQRNSW